MEYTETKEMEAVWGDNSLIDSWMQLVRKVRWNFPGLETEESLEEHKQTVLKFMNKKQALCVRNKETVVGVLLFSRSRNMICCLAVDPEHRKQGVASVLLRKALDELGRSKEITVSTFRENDDKGIAPRALYRKFGFQEGEMTEEFGYPNQVFVLYPEISVCKGKCIMNLKLIKLTKAYENQLGEMIDEWRADQELNHTNHSPWAIFKNDYHDFDYYLENLEVKEEADGKVPDSVFFLLDTDRDRLLGAINIRHYLNDELRKEGGHIGDGIRPTERRKGYATEMIRLALIECRKLGLDKVLMTCDKDNIGSAKSIINNGGILENEFINSDGEIEQRYWIIVRN